MRVAAWNVEKVNGKIMNQAMDRLEAAGNIVKAKAINNLRAYIGKGKTTGISHGVYQRGKYKGKYWTAREFGSLLKTIRVVRKYGDPTQNVWVMAGNKKVYYAQIVEFNCSFLRRALRGSKGQIRTIIKSATFSGGSSYIAKGGTF